MAPVLCRPRRAAASIFGLLALLAAPALAGCEETPPETRAEPVKAAAGHAHAEGAAQTASNHHGPAGACGDKQGCGGGEKGAGSCCGSCGDKPNGGGCGCGNKAAGDTAGGPVVPITEAKIGDRSKCPVTGSVFTVSEQSPSVDLDGKTYRFCCGGCAVRFRQDPAKYIQS